MEEALGQKDGLCVLGVFLQVCVMQLCNLSTYCVYTGLFKVWP